MRPPPPSSPNLKIMGNRSGMLCFRFLIFCLVIGFSVSSSMSQAFPPSSPIATSPSYGGVPASPSYSYPAVPSMPVYPAPEAELVSPFPAPVSSPSVPSISPIQFPFPLPPQSAWPVPGPSPSSMPAPVSSPPASPSPKPSPVPPSRGIKAAYWPSYDAADFSVVDIDTSYFTHIYYAFLLPDPNSLKLSITPNDEEMLPKFVSTFKAQNPLVATLLSIGGGGNDPNVFSKIAMTSTTRAIFIESTINVARQHGFDGVDLDWEFPANPQDMANLGTLYKEWRRALSHEAKATGRARLLLTSAVYYASHSFLSGVPRSYPGHAIAKYVDWVSPMCFDYHGAWGNFTGYNAALYDPTSNVSTSYGIQAWIGSGVPSHKLVMGLPVYGRTWQLKDPNVHGTGAPAVGAGPGNLGTMTYLAIVNYNAANNARVVYDAQAESMYSYAADAWIGYDNPITIGKKVEFARTQQLGGYFLWALGQDKDWSISRQASSTWEKL